MLITPANGCAAFTVSSATITGSTASRFATDQWTFVDPHDDTSYERYWPYAAMDYYIQLDSAPDISSFNENFSEIEIWSDVHAFGLGYFVLLPRQRFARAHTRLSRQRVQRRV